MTGAVSHSHTTSVWRLAGFVYESWRRGHVRFGWALFAFVLALSVGSMAEEVAADVR